MSLDNTHFLFPYIILLFLPIFSYFFISILTLLFTRDTRDNKKKVSNIKGLSRP